MRPLLERFLDQCIPEPMSGCWIWTSTLDRWGYGKIKIDGRFIKAHRCSYALHKGEINLGQVVRHACDVPACVNPDHLLVGTHQDNAWDRVRRNRSHKFNGSRAGEGNPRARLTWDQVLRIRSMAEMSTSAALADEFGVAKSTVRDIIARKRWTQ